MVFWHPKGWTLWQQVEQYMRARLPRQRLPGSARARRSSTARCGRSSGHWENYKDNMFTTESEKRDFAVKPMNCPGHVQIFNSDLRSYRDLPLRYGEFGACHRNEPSGALHGIMRVRGFTQDDGHIFCTEDADRARVRRLPPARASTSTRDFGFTRHRDQARAAPRQAHRRRRARGTAPRTRCATRCAPAARAGRSCRARARSTARRSSTTSRTRSAARGSAARCRSTSRCPARLGAEYVAEDNTRQVPVMLHRAIVGSHGALHRHPDRELRRRACRCGSRRVQVGGAEHHRPPGGVRAARSPAALRAAGFRAAADLRNEKITYKIREHSMQKLPYQLILGDKEVAGEDGGRADPRRRGSRRHVPLEALLARLRKRGRGAHMKALECRQALCASLGVPRPIF